MNEAKIKKIYITEKTYNKLGEFCQRYDEMPCEIVDESINLFIDTINKTIDCIKYTALINGNIKEYEEISEKTLEEIKHYKI